MSTKVVIPDAWDDDWEAQADVSERLWDTPECRLWNAIVEYLIPNRPLIYSPELDRRGEYETRG